MVAQAIRDLAVRGAPAIGVAAAMGAALGARQIREDDRTKFLSQFHAVCNDLRAARPTAVNLFWAIDRVEAAAQTSKAESIEQLQADLVQLARQMYEDDVTINRRLGHAGASLIPDGANILTHCNTGSLATCGYGTALGVIRAAVEAGKTLHVFVDETRPLLQGARLTTWELMQDQIPCTLITDNMAGSLMKSGTIDICIVGADRIAANGDTANKIGTYSIAVLAKAHQIPFYVAAPTSTIDFALSSGEAIPIEERDAEEVTSFPGSGGELTLVAPKGMAAFNPAFDVTPTSYISAIITEHGVYLPHELTNVRLPRERPSRPSIPG